MELLYYGHIGKFEASEIEGALQNFGTRNASRLMTGSNQRSHIEQAHAYHCLPSFTSGYFQQQVLHFAAESYYQGSGFFFLL